MSTQIIDLGYGKSNLSNTLATWGVMKVEPPFQRTSAVTTGIRHGSNRVVSVGTQDFNGQLIASRVEHPQGTVILLQASWKRGGVALREGAFFLRLREGAPTYRICAKLPQGHENRAGDTFPLFMGTADILNEADMALRGLKVNNSYTQKFMSSEELDECFTLSMVSPGSAPALTVTAIATPEGIKLRETQEAPSRRLRFGARRAS